MYYALFFLGTSKYNAGFFYTILVVGVVGHYWFVEFLEPKSLSFCPGSDFPKHLNYQD